MLNLLGILFFITAISAYINTKYLKVHMSIGLTIITIFISIGVLSIQASQLINLSFVKDTIKNIEFDEIVMQGLLAILLFASALNIKLADLKQEKWHILLLAIGATFITIFVTGSIIYVSLIAFQLFLPYTICLLFGALISPTDPIAVLSILTPLSQGKEACIDKKTLTIIGGESLFNDGVAVVLFLTLSSIAFKTTVEIDPAKIAFNLLWEMTGGALLGFSLGYIIAKILKTIEDFTTLLLFTLTLAIIVYVIAQKTHLSGPIAVACAGITIGNNLNYITDVLKEALIWFWELIDEILNAILFSLIGLELMILPLKWNYIGYGVIAIIAVIIGRFISLLLTEHSTIQQQGDITSVLKKKIKSNIFLTWAGLRGAISIALVLSMPNFAYKNLLIAMTYLVVIFSVVIQGLTIEKVLNFLYQKN